MIANNKKPYFFVTKWKECQDFVAKVKGEKPLFLLVIGSTETALIGGISAAGQSTEKLKLTPAFDADFLLSSKSTDLLDAAKKIPVSPSGIPSPVILSKAMAEHLELDILVVDAGAFVKPNGDHLALSMGPAKSIVTGNALGPIKTNFLYQRGEKLISNFSKYPYVIIGECVPGGTTTALSVLCALGINAFDLVSSSFPEGTNLWKSQIVKDALLEHSNLFTLINKTPLKACDFFGDPMQVFIAGLIKGSQKANLPLMLAGGSQMLAVYYLSKRILEYDPQNIVIGTTSWVANDKNARTKKLAELCSAPLIASGVNFKESKHSGLSAYEEGHIKEGVGAGGLMIAASLYKEADEYEIMHQIEKVYEQYMVSLHP